MIDGATREVWAHRILFVVLALVFLFFRLLPLGEVIAPCGPEATGCRLMAWFSHMPGPDLLLCIIFAWTMRRPDYLPVLLIAAVVLLEDLIMLRPPGLWTGLVVLVSEIIRSRVALARELNFGVEWLLVSAMMVVMLIVYRMAFGLVLLPQPPFGFAMVQVIWSILCYPLVVFLSRVVLDLYKPGMGEVDAYGRRL
jgi:rod shape-determining protein MreD